jgi:hypothetical protein
VQNIERSSWAQRSLSLLFFLVHDQLADHEQEACTTAVCMATGTAAITAGRRRRVAELHTAGHMAVNGARPRPCHSANAGCGRSGEAPLPLSRSIGSAIETPATTSATPSTLYACTPSMSWRSRPPSGLRPRTKKGFTLQTSLTA